MLESQTLEKMALGTADPQFAPSYDPPLREAASGGELPLGTAILNSAFSWLP